MFICKLLHIAKGWEKSLARRWAILRTERDKGPWLIGTRPSIVLMPWLVMVQNFLLLADSPSCWGKWKPKLSTGHRDPASPQTRCIQPFLWGFQLYSLLPTLAPLLKLPKFLLWTSYIKNSQCSATVLFSPLWCKLHVALKFEHI